MKVLIACEESQRVCIAFRQHDFESYSADIQEPSGNHPEWHVKDDVLKILNPCNNEIVFKTMDNNYHFIEKWDLIIAHPPCTFLTNTGNRWFNIEKYGDKAIKRYSERDKAMKFFMEFVNADCEHIAIENPIGYMSTSYRKPDQIIQPYEYGHYERKATCLWLKGINPLTYKELPKPDNKRFFGIMPSGKAKTWEDSLCRAGGADKARSKTFPGIAKAMAEQWAGKA